MVASVVPKYPSQQTRERLLPAGALPRQILGEQVLTLWREGRRDTHSIAAELGIAEREVCEIIEQSAGLNGEHHHGV